MNNEANNLTASVVITTKNRKDELRAALASAVAQSAKPEVLVIDDGCTDGTADMIRAEFPSVRIERSEQSRGLIVQRNRAATLASGDVIFSIDDDAIFSTPLIVEQIVSQFDHPRIGAIAIPFINVKQNDIIQQNGSATTQRMVTHAYIGTAHAIRRDVFLRLGGYREFFFHQGEEGDYCIRMLAAGCVVTLGRSDPIHHFESPKRDKTRMDLYGRRNDVLFCWCNVPSVNLPVHMLATIGNGLKLGVQVGRKWNMVRGVGKGIAGIFQFWSKRQPVSRGAYRLMRTLKKQCLPFDDAIAQLPPMPSGR